MSNEQLLQAISDMMDQKLDEQLEQKLDCVLDNKLQPLYTRLDKVDERLDKIDERLDKIDERLDDFYLEFKGFEKDITKSVHKLQDEMETVIEILKINELVPH